MSEKWTRRLLFPGSVSAAFTLMILAIFSAAPARAQRGRHGGAAPMGRPMQRPMQRSMPRYDPYYNPPGYVYHVQPPQRMPQNRYNSQTDSRQTSHTDRYQTRATSSPTYRVYAPSKPRKMRRPVYTPMTSSSYRARVSAIRALQNPYAINGYSGPMYWGAYGWSPFYPGGGFFVDPFDLAFFSGAGCYGFSSWNNLSLDPYSAQFAYSPFGNPLFGSDPFCGAAYSPALFAPAGSFEAFGAFGTVCPLCTITPTNPFAFGLDSGSLASSPAKAASSAPRAGGAFSGPSFGAGPAAMRESFEDASPSEASATPALSDLPFATNPPAKNQPLALVFNNGLTTEASGYWLGSDAKLHYVTASGDQMSIPLADFNMSATMAANRQKGLDFFAPPSYLLHPAPKQQP